MVLNRLSAVFVKKVAEPPANQIVIDISEHRLGNGIELQDGAVAIQNKNSVACYVQE